MLRIVEGYDGSDASVNVAVVRLYEAYWGRDGWAVKRIDPGEVSRWFSAPGGKALFYLGGVLVGAAWAWTAGATGSIWLLFDCTLPAGAGLRLASCMLAWSRLSLLGRGVRGVADVRCGFWHGPAHRAVRLALGGCGVDVSWGTLMVLEGWEPLRRPPPRGVALEDCRAVDEEELAQLLNEAFAGYEWWSPLTSEDLRQRLNRRQMHCLVALGGEGVPLGYLDFEVFRALDGGETAEIGFLAVRPGFQGRGVGKALLSCALGELRSRGVDRIVVDSAAGRESFYAGLGFRVYKRWAMVRAPLDSLPQGLPTLERF